MDLSAWEKKTVTLDWGGLRLPFRVAQELFSSHDIDQGTKLLLRSLDLDRLPEAAAILDFGCGYGPLGLALKASVPTADVVLVDRDALAVEFAAWNARELGIAGGTVVRGGLDLSTDSAPNGYDLILWNVPGKAGESVLRGLVGDVPSALASGGVLALVVVNPLASAIRAALAAHPGLTGIHDEEHTAHTVLHVRGENDLEPRRPRRSAFHRGVFDRPRETLAWRGHAYDFQPVFGLPEYDEPDYASALLMETLDSPVLSAQRFDVIRLEHVGQGHTAVRAAQVVQPHRIDLADRDLLALNATQRNLELNGVNPACIHALHTVGRSEHDASQPMANLVLARLDAQISPQRGSVRYRQLLDVLSATGTLIVGGPSTSVSRFLDVASKDKGKELRELFRRRRQGMSVAIMRRR